MKVVVTGIGVWCALGRTLDDFTRALCEGTCGRRRVTRLDLTSNIYRMRDAATLADEEQVPSDVDETRIGDLTLVVARDAMRHAQLDVTKINPRRFGVALGTSHGGNIAFMKLIRGLVGAPGGRTDHALALCTGGTLVGQTARRVGALGPTLTISTACASGTNSVGRAAEWIRDGRVDLMLAGGADLFTELSFSGFTVLGAMTRTVCRPLDENRDGMMLGDGAAMFVLESEAHAIARGARQWVEIAGHAIANDAYHATAPDPNGSAIARVMVEALRDAGLNADEIDYVNLHGTGTVANDATELRAMRTVFGSRASQVLVSSSKSQFGHALGAAGSLELAATSLGVASGWVPPSINLETPIRGFEDLRYVRNRAEPARIRAAMSNSLGFGGNIASIVVRRIY